MSDMFSADLPGLRRLAGFAGDRANDVRAIGKDLQGLPQASDDAFGDAGALDAYRAFYGAWVEELSINANSLDESVRSSRIAPTPTRIRTYIGRTSSNPSGPTPDRLA